MQAFSLRDPGIQGAMWVSKIAVPRPAEEDALSHLLRAVDALKDPKAVYDVPSLESVEAEWTGFRSGVGPKTKPLERLEEGDVYKRMMADTKSDVTVLYMHGGALYLMDPASHRLACSRLARICGGRCLSVRYRLAPKHPFPAALLDCLLAYLYLLRPPEGAFHEPVPAEKIVFAGDSAGGTLSFALLQLILQLHRAAPPGQTPTVRFHGEDVPLPLPAGVATSSAWFDLTMSMPSVRGNLMWDYLPPPKGGSLQTRYPKCALWPADPAREDLYCDASMLMHPLVSPLAAGNAFWKGCCPAFLMYGQEFLQDDGQIMARRLAGQGVAVRWHLFDGMPHCWQFMLQDLEGSKRAMELWGGFIAAVARGEPVETSGVFHEAKSLRESVVDVETLGSELTDALVEEKMRAIVKTKLAYGAKSSEDTIKAKL